MQAFNLSKASYDCLICTNTDDYPPHLVGLAQNALVIACDGALGRCQQAGLSPNLVLGDFDSIDTKPPPGCTRLHIAEQNSTDTEKALGLAKSRGYASLALAGLSAGRFDHSLYHLQLLWRYSRSFTRLHWYGRVDCCWLTHTSQRICTTAGQRVSLFAPWGKAVVDLPNARYPVHNYAMATTGNSSHSNAATGRVFDLIVHSGAVLVCLGLEGPG